MIIDTSALVSILDQEAEAERLVRAIAAASERMLSAANLVETGSHLAKCFHRSSAIFASFVQVVNFRTRSQPPNPRRFHASSDIGYRRAARFSAIIFSMYATAISSAG